MVRDATIDYEIVGVVSDLSTNTLEPELIVGLHTTWGPARRSLRIQPTEALRAE